MSIKDERDLRDFTVALRKELGAPLRGDERVSDFLIRMADDRLLVPDRVRLRRISALFDRNETLLDAADKRRAMREKDRKERAVEKAKQPYKAGPENDVEFLTRLSRRPSWAHDRERLERIIRKVVDSGPSADEAGDHAKAQAEPNAHLIGENYVSIQWAGLIQELRYRLPAGTSLHMHTSGTPSRFRLILPDASLCHLTPDNASDVEAAINAFEERMRQLIGGPIRFVRGEGAPIRDAPAKAEAAPAKGWPTELAELCGEQNVAMAALQAGEFPPVVRLFRRIGESAMEAGRRMHEAIEKLVRENKANPHGMEIVNAEIDRGIATAFGIPEEALGKAASEARRVAAYGGDPQAAAYAATHAAAAAAGVQLTDVGPTVADAILETGRKTHDAANKYAKAKREAREAAAAPSVAIPDTGEWICTRPAPLIIAPPCSGRLCNAINKPGSGVCWRCNLYKYTDATTKPNPDDWKCPGCDSMQCNWITEASSELRVSCRNCGSPRPRSRRYGGDLLATATEAAHALGKTGAKLVKPSVMLPKGDWICDCNHRNAETDFLCTWCKKPRPDEAAEVEKRTTTWMCGYCQHDNPRAEDRCVCGRGKPPIERETEAAMESQPWRCKASSRSSTGPTCGVHNSAAHLSCWRCHSPAPGEMACVRWECTLCHFEQAHLDPTRSKPRRFCLSCGGARPQVKAEPLPNPGHSKPAKWKCANGNCGTLNPDPQPTCRRCGHTRNGEPVRAKFSADSFNEIARNPFIDS